MRTFAQTLVEKSREQRTKFMHFACITFAQYCRSDAFQGGFMVPDETQGTLSSSQTIELTFSAFSALTFKRVTSSMSIAKNSSSTKLLLADVLNCSFSLQASNLPQLRLRSTSMLAFKRAVSSMSMATNSSSTELLALFLTSFINRERNSVA